VHAHPVLAGLVPSSIGGVEVFAARLLPALVRRGHEVTVVAGHHCAGLPERTDFEGVTVHRFPFHQVLSLHDAGRTAALLGEVSGLKRAVQPDVLHLNTLGPSVLFHLRTMAHAPAPVLLTMHSPVAEDAARPDTLYGRALRSADRVNCNSQAVRAELCRRVPEASERSTVVYYGMEKPALRPGPRPWREPRVLGYGRLVPEKGFDLLVRAFALVVARYPRARLVLAGEGGVRGDLERLAAELGVAAAVDFVGPVSPAAVPALLDAASLVVVPSRWAEPFGLVALEAALMARPVVAARTGGLPEVVEDGVTGVLVEREDVAGLADAIARLLADPAGADGMGVAGRERARVRFGWDRRVGEYEQLYEWTRRTPRTRGGVHA